MDFIKKVATFFDVAPTYPIADELPTRKRPGPTSRFDERVAKLKQLPPKQQELVLLMIDSFLAQARRP